MNTKEPEYLRKTFDLDYWGSSYRQGLEYILKTDSATKINVTGVPNAPINLNSMILKQEDKKRLIDVEDSSKADYMLTNFRNHPQDFPYPDSKIYYSIKVLNSSILTIYKLK